MSGWRIVYDGYDPAEEGQREALCTLGNGFFATRGAAPEAEADGVHYPGTYAAGLYNRLTDEIGGVVVENESIVNLPNWLPVRFATPHEWFDPDRVELLSYRQELDLRHGVLTRSLRFRDGAGHETTVVQKRIVHMALPHLAGLTTTITPENWAGRLRIRSSISGDVVNAGVQRYRALSGRHLGDIRCTNVDGSVLLVAETSQSRVRVAVAARTVVRTSSGATPSATPVSRERLDGGSGEVGHEFTVEVSPHETVVVEKVAALYTSRDPAISEPATEAVDELGRAEGFDALLGSHRHAWERLWRLFGIQVRGNRQPLPADFLPSVRLGLFHLLQTVSPHSTDLDVGVPARGLHGEAYRGHVFWDEMFVIPVIKMRLPGLARALLLYRHRRLPAARRAARDLGLRGALFPWQSGSDGREESQQLHLNPASGRWLEDVTHRQRHSGIAVAMSAWRFYEATGDREFLYESAAELIVDIALFFASLATYDGARARYVLTGVVGPDEYHTGYPGTEPKGIDNNAYTNVMAVWVLRIALRVLDHLPPARRRDLMQSLQVTAKDLTRWEHITERMFVPFHDGVISQFEGYGELAELDWDAYRARYGDIRRLDRLLEAEGSSTNDFKASKQADVLMLFYLLTAEDLDDILRGLGYDWDRASIPAIIDYYLARTCDGSTLSSVVHAWVLARSRRGRALELLVDVVNSDVHDVQGGTTAEGVHLAALVAGADLLQRCFAGVVPRMDALHLEPSWPAELGTMVFVIRYRDQDLTVQVDARSVRVLSEPGHGPSVPICCAGSPHLLAPGGELVVPLTDHAD